MEELKTALKSLLDRVDPENPVEAMENLAKRFEEESGFSAPKRYKKMTGFDEAYYNMLCEKYNEWRKNEWKEFCGEIRTLI